MDHLEVKNKSRKSYRKCRRYKIYVQCTTRFVLSYPDILFIVLILGFLGLLSSRVVHPSVVEYFHTWVQGAVW